MAWSPPVEVHSMPGVGVRPGPGDRRCEDLVDPDPTSFTRAAAPNE